MHKYDPKAFGPGAKASGPFHVVHNQGNMTVAGFDDEQNALDDAEARTAKAKKMGLSTAYEVRPKSDGKSA